MIIPLRNYRVKGFIFPGLTFVVLFYADIKVKEKSLENLMR